MNILDYSLNDILFAYWLKRMLDIQKENGGMWKGNYHPKPIPLHKAIDDRLDFLRTRRNPNLSCLYFLIKNRN